MSIFNAKDISVFFGETMLFKDVSFAVEANDKIGLVGTNGAGKSTLLKLLMGQCPEDYTGAITKAADVEIGFMEQHVLSSTDASVYEEALSIFKPLIEAEQELEDLHRRIDSGDRSSEILEKQMRLTEEFQNKGGLTFRARTQSMLEGMGFQKALQDKSVSVLSGGERSKLQLVKLLLSGAKLLLLDEPTNHLDIAATEWLENYLLEFKGAYILISHDRYFLDKVTNKTFALDNKTLDCYKGNYSAYLKQYDERVAFLEKKYKQDVEEIERIEKIIEQQKRFNQEHNYVTIKSKQKQIDRIKEQLVPPPPKKEHIRFAFPCKTAHGTDVLLAQGLSFDTGKQKLFSDVELDIKFGERIFLLGSNGCGKSTLMKSLVGKIPLQSGSVRIADWIKTGYFDQLQDLRFQSEKSILDFVWDEFPQLTKTQVMSALAVFRIRGEEALKPMNKISGGEAAKTVLLKIMLSGPNLLLFDEPTNHLDLEAREALIDALDGYEGTMLIISHDRTLINAVATKLVFLTESGIEIFEGNYDEYQQKRGLQSLAAQREEKAEKPQNSYKLQKELQSKIRKTKHRLEIIEKELEQIGERIDTLNALMQSAERSYEQLMDDTTELSELDKKQNELLEEWESLDNALSELENS